MLFLQSTKKIIKFQYFFAVFSLQEFGVLEPVQDGSDAVMERIGLLEDMRREKEQQDMLTALIADAPPNPIAMDEVNELAPLLMIN